MVMVIRAAGTCAAPALLPSLRPESFNTGNANFHDLTIQRCFSYNIAIFQSHNFLEALIIILE